MNRLGVRLASLAAVVALVVGLLFRPAWAGGLTRSSLPAFSYPFSGLPLVRYDGGTTKQVGSYNFPVSTNIAGVYMTLEPGAIRELHWHAMAT